MQRVWELAVWSASLILNFWIPAGAFRESTSYIPGSVQLIKKRLFNFPLADGIVSELLADDNATENLISLNRARLSDNYQHVTKLLKAYGIPYTQSNAALFVWIYLGSVASDSAGSDSDILDNLRREKVYITAGSTYASEKPGWFRIVIAHPKHILDEGFKRIIQAISLN